MTLFVCRLDMKLSMAFEDISLVKLFVDETMISQKMWGYFEQAF